MANKYKVAGKRLKLDAKNPFLDRVFLLVTIAALSPEFDESETTMEAVLKHEKNEKVDEFNLRTQLIQDPTLPLSDSKILQFFAVDPNRDALRNNRHPGVLFERDGDKEIPLFLLNRDEIHAIAIGEGFATQLPAD